MLKWHFVCTVCGASTNRKTSGSIAPENWKKEEPKIECPYCESKMECTDCVDSTFMIKCNGPIMNFHKLKPEYQDGIQA